MLAALAIYEGKQIIIKENIEEKNKDIIYELSNRIKKVDNNHLEYIFNENRIYKKLELNQILNDKNKNINL